MPTDDYTNGVTPLYMYQPYNVAVLMTFYSPLVITILILSLSFIFQNLKGIGYMVWLLVFSWLRSLVLELTGSLPLVAKSKDLCSMVQYTKYGNSTFSMFFIAFSFVYVCGPMFLNRNVNFWTVSAFVFYYAVDAAVRTSSGCIVDMSSLALDTFCGMCAGIISLALMYVSNGQRYLYFNEMSSSKDVCTMPTKQTFKCKVYKNGEMIGQTNG